MVGLHDLALTLKEDLLKRVLATLRADCLGLSPVDDREGELVRVPSLRRDEDDLAVTAKSFATMFVNGVDVRWRTLDGVPADAWSIFAATRTSPRAEAC